MRRARRVAAPAAACVAAKVAWDLSRPAAAESSGEGPVVRRSSVTDDIKWRGIAWSPRGVPEREHQIEALKSGKPFDILVIGAGATGCGVTLDAATRGLKTACVDKGDFACETSSRSSKLLWGGSKYIATAAASLFSWGTLSDPIGAVKAFYSEMKMVYNCHQERTFMMETHPHLVNWIPLAIPIREWIMWEPVLDHPLFMILPLIAPLFTKFYDSLSFFHCPPSYVLGPKMARETFPQLADDLKYCAVLHEGQHNDARTCTSIAMTAALKGATIANHVEVLELLFDADGKACGATCVDKLSGAKFDVHSKAVVFAGGPFTDSLRKKEDPECKPAVGAGAGTHIVLPAYYSPSQIGLADLRTSRGAFLFFLPWNGATVVGTTDKKSPAQSSPAVDEDEIQYLLNEVGRYLSPELQVRRSDVLSAWRGWRPLASDPNAPPGAPVSRDHLLSYNPKTGICFITGGKWTTYREMAEDTVNRVIKEKGFKDVGPCVTRHLPLIGSENFKPGYRGLRSKTKDLLTIKLIQKFGLSSDVAEHLVRAYGWRAMDVCTLSKPTEKLWPRYGRLLVEGYPFIEEEVEYCCGEYCRSVKDMLSLRMRLAYINSEAAKEAVPRVADIMAEKLGWSSREKKRQITEATAYMNEFGGPVPDKSGAKLRTATFEDLSALFKELDADGSGYLDMREVGQAASRLGFPFANSTELTASFELMDSTKSGRITEHEFVEWWNGKGDSFHKQLHDSLKVDPAKVSKIFKGP